MNWLQKIAQGSFRPGQYVLLSHFGYQDFSVVQVVDWDQIGELSPKHQIKGDDVTSPNPFGSMTWSRNEGSIPCLIVDSYGNGPAQNTSNTPGNVSIVNPSNLYRTLEDLILQQSKTLYPDVLMGIINSNHIGDFLQDYPKLRGFESISDSLDKFVDYEQFEDDSGHVIQVFRDPRAYVGMGRKEAEKVVTLGIGQFREPLMQPVNT